MQETLSGGFPVLTNDDALGTNGESLAYLFDPAVTHQGKESYPGVNQFLYVDKDGYYTYDSRDYRADYNDDGTFTLREQTAEGSDRGFWPFGTSTYWSSMHINAQFSMPENGKVLNPRGEYKDMQFEFSGDDDTWIYVDGVLIGDAGGIHNRAEVDINFATGNVYINNELQGTLRQMIEAAKRDEIAGFTDEEAAAWNAQWNGNTFAAGSYHTFDMFYLERGGDQSNLYVHYNLVSTADFTAHKSYEGYDDEDVMKRNQFRFELIGLDGKYRSVWSDEANDYVLVQEDTTSEAIMPHASSSGAGTTVSPYYTDDYSTELSDGTSINSQIYITGNVEDGNVNFGNAQIPEQDMHDCDEGNPPVYRYMIREVVPDDAVNADNITWADATLEQREAGGFVKDSIIYDNEVYYMTARVMSWTETDASGTPRTRYGLSKTYYTDDTFTTKRENTPFVDFRNRYTPDHADFEFDKIDANEEPVEGVVFGLYRDSACKIPAKDSDNTAITAASDSQGKVTFTDVRTGTYFMKEISAPDPYDLNPTVYRVTISRQGSYMSVNSDQNNNPVTQVFNLKAGDITVNKKWVDEQGREVSGAGHPATVQLRRYRYVSTGPAPETHTVMLHFHFPYASWLTDAQSNPVFGPYEVTGNSVAIHWKVGGCQFFWDEARTQQITGSGEDNLVQLPLDRDLELDIYGNQNWAASNITTVSVDGAVDDSKELRLDASFPSASEVGRATQTLTADSHMHAWSIGVGDDYDFPPGDEIGLFYYYLVELDAEGNEVPIGSEVSEGMTLKSIDYSPEKTEGAGITHGLITVTNEIQVPHTGSLRITKAVLDNGNAPETEEAKQHVDGDYIFKVTSKQGIAPAVTRYIQITVEGGAAVSYRVADSEEGLESAEVREESSALVTDLMEGDYLVEEVNKNGLMLTGFDRGDHNTGAVNEEDVTVTVHVTAGDFDGGEASAQATFTNSYFENDGPDKITLDIVKTFAGISSLEEVPDGSDGFEVVVGYMLGGAEKSITLKKEQNEINPDGIKIVETTDGFTLSWHITNVPTEAADFKIKEANYDSVSGYDFTAATLDGTDITGTAGDWHSLTVEAPTATLSKVTNERHTPDSPGDLSYILEDGDIVLSKLTGNEGTLVISEKSLNSVQRKAVENGWPSQGGFKKHTIYWFSIEEHPEGFGYGGKTVTFRTRESDGKTIVTFTSSAAAQEDVFAVSYDSHAELNNASLTNTYTRQIVTLDIIKVKEGDTDKKLPGAGLRSGRSKTHWGQTGSSTTAMKAHLLPQA